MNQDHNIAALTAAETEIAPRELTPPPIQAPTAKEKKYDRQLRLWAASGQRALEESHALLVVDSDEHGSNSTVAGAETLKNLILPGVGSFTIADAAKVSAADLGVNFFLEQSSLQKSRAEEMTKFLQELNPDVHGHATTIPLSEICKPENLQQFNLILVCAPVPEEQAITLASYAYRKSIPLVYLQSVGFYSSFSIQLPAEFPVVDTHPDPDTLSDLRLTRPWLELSQAVKDIGHLEQMEDHDHGHVPWVLLLIHYLEEWKEQRNTSEPPSNFKEKADFREFVRSKARTNNPEGGEENFDEACAAVLKSINTSTIGDGCKQMFDMPQCNSDPKSYSQASNFWIIANAIRSFYTSQGVLPLPGSLPDMKATSHGYIRLQNIYKSKARADVAEVTRTVRSTEKTCNRTTPIKDIEIELFCKNASHVRVLTNAESLLPQNRLSSPKTLVRLRTALANDFNEVAGVFVALNQNLFSTEMISEICEKHEYVTNMIEEVKRAEWSELHNISSVTGGMVAQECIKLLTRQYVPVHGTCVFDGIGAKVGTFIL